MKIKRLFGNCFQELFFTFYINIKKKLENMFDDEKLFYVFYS